MDLINVCKCSRTYGLDKVKELLGVCTYVNIQNISNGSTALMYAAMYSGSCSTETTVRTLLEAGADVNQQNYYGSTALMYAAAWSNDLGTEITVKILLETGADVNIQDNLGHTALQMATRQSNNSTTAGAVKMLIDAGANYDTKVLFKNVHKDKRKVLYDCIILPRRVVFGLGGKDPGSIVSSLPKEIVREILNLIIIE